MIATFSLKLVSTNRKLKRVATRAKDPLKKLRRSWNCFWQSTRSHLMFGLVEKTAPFFLLTLGRECFYMYWAIDSFKGEFHPSSEKELEKAKFWN